MEFVLRHAHDVHTQVFIQLASSSQTSSRAGRKLDSVMEFGRELVCDLLASWTAQWNLAFVKHTTVVPAVLISFFKCIGHSYTVKSSFLSFGIIHFT